MKHAPENKEEGSLTDEEIEAILAQEAAHAPEATEHPPEPRLVEREPGQGNYRKWMAWALIAFIALGVINAYR
jgi:hypothetical protein